MHALAKGWPGGRTCVGLPPDDGNLAIVWGQIWLAEELIVAARKSGRRYFQIDNGFYEPACGGPKGYYRFMYCRPDPVFVQDVKLLYERAENMNLLNTITDIFAPWRTDGKHVLIAMPGEEAFRAHGLDMKAWRNTIVGRVQSFTQRPLMIRDRLAPAMPLREALKDCWALVTHSSNVAVDALRAGIPVFVEPTSMAAPVGNLSLGLLDNPWMPNIGFVAKWWTSLMCQQFTIDEMRRGMAFQYLSRIHGS